MKYLIFILLLVGCSADPVKDYELEKMIVKGNRDWCKIYLTESKKLTDAEMKTVCRKIYPQPQLPWACRDLDKNE